MIQEHAQAVLSLLSPGTHTLYDGQVPKQPTFPYRVFFFDPGGEAATRLCGTSNQVDVRFQLTSVGLTADAARIVADAGRALVLDQAPAVAGRSCTRIRRETAIPIRPDRDETDTDTGMHPMFAVDTYHFVSYAS